ncbi:MAG: hypothetical protein JWN78_1245 [Bacteroidota bacterium]|nr:hypothetical protein [Bacteroidota bacterium]
MLFVRFCLIFSYNIDLDGAEFTFVHYIQQMLSGKPLYLNPESYPFSAVIYTPLYLHLVYWTCKFCDIDYIYNIRGIYFLGRCISFFFVFIGIFFLDKFVQKKSRDPLARLAVACLFMIMLTGHAYVLRPDSAKIAFFIAFLFYHIEYFYYTNNKKHLAFSLLFAVLSISAKQDAIIYILLVQAVNIFVIKNTTALKVLLLFITTFTLLFLSFQLVFGNYCLVNLFPFNLQINTDFKDSYNLVVLIVNGVRIMPFYLFIIFNLVKYRNENSSPAKMLMITAIIAGLTSTFFLLRPGSYLNYTYEFVVLLLFCMVMILSERKFSKTTFRLGFLYILFFFFSNISIKNYFLYPPKEKIYTKDYKHYYLLRDELLPLLNNNEKIYCPHLDLTLFVPDKNVIYGQEYHLDRLIYTHLGLKSKSRLALNSSAHYDEYFVNGEVKYIIGFDNEEVKNLVSKTYPHYKLNRKIDRFLLYEYTR